MFFFVHFPVHKLASSGPKLGQEDFFPTHPDLADILGDMDLAFENLYVFDFWVSKFPDFQVPDFQISRNLAWARLGHGRAGPGLVWA